jgi:hypothetical protein
MPKGVVMIFVVLSSLLISSSIFVVFATNESSYKYGWQSGFGTYQCRITLIIPLNKRYSIIFSETF